MRLAPLELRDGDREVLEGWARAGTVEARVAKRARIILLAADGRSNRDIAATVDLHYNQVGIWRQRYQAYGLGGLSDEERSGRPVVYGHDDVLLLVKLVTERPPDCATRWTMEALAQAMAAHGVPISASQCWRICQALDLKPWQTESWMTSHDPDFWAKAADVCGLYLDPPEAAIVWSVDEKSGMQAKSRVNPTKPAVPGIAARREFEYRRNGTAVLFAGLNVHDGGVAGWVTDSTRSENFVEFLVNGQVDVPAPVRGSNAGADRRRDLCRRIAGTGVSAIASAAFRACGRRLGACVLARIGPGTADPPGWGHRVVEGGAA